MGGGGELQWRYCAHTPAQDHVIMVFFGNLDTQEKPAFATQRGFWGRLHKIEQVEVTDMSDNTKTAHKRLQSCCNLAKNILVVVEGKNIIFPHARVADSFMCVSFG